MDIQDTESAGGEGRGKLKLLGRRWVFTCWEISTGRSEQVNISRIIIEYVCMVAHIARIWIDRVRLLILHVVS